MQQHLGDSSATADYRLIACQVDSTTNTTTTGQSRVFTRRAATVASVADINVAVLTAVTMYFCFCFCICYIFAWLFCLLFIWHVVATFSLCEQYVTM